MMPKQDVWWMGKDGAEKQTSCLIPLWEQGLSTGTLSLQGRRLESPVGQKMGPRSAFSEEAYLS